MNEEYEELISSFQIADDLEQAVDSAIQTRLDEFSATPLTALPLEDDVLIDRYTSFPVKRVESRVIQRLKAA